MLEQIVLCAHIQISKTSSVKSRQRQAAVYGIHNLLKKAVRVCDLPGAITGNVLTPCGNIAVCQVIGGPGPTHRVILFHQPGADQGPQIGLAFVVRESNLLGDLADPVPSIGQTGQNGIIALRCTAVLSEPLRQEAGEGRIKAHKPSKVVLQAAVFIQFMKNREDTTGHGEQANYILLGIVREHLAIVGQRPIANIIESATSKIISTMKEMGTVRSIQTGRHELVETNVEENEIVAYMVQVAMYLGRSSYYSFSALTEFPFLFPFKYQITKEQVAQDERFTLSTFDSTLSVSLKS